ncbi:Cu(I)-responsive transcriptional regulator [Methylobacterium iners]|uniref:HTH-type transcriptional regulator HmrR n=1 Tax=Methylobacterium iners TaxID=418707 RepID=A0ABQ4RUJ1_9HYPH|nr:Cu(I)-responsive transcriptional regulator [Methylobacterium iners]GJD94478.1 HTH-type transcriptional regulator HmrR [Methylobacterium iners]
MNIGQAAEASGVSAKMIRYYESIELVPRADRRESGYREYGVTDLHRLGFIRHARDLGFSLERIKVLLGLWSDPGRSNADVKAIARAHIRELEGRARQLNEMADALRSLADACDGDGRPDCPIIASLETGANVPACHAGDAPAAPEPPVPRRKLRARH